MLDEVLGILDKRKKGFVFYGRFLSVKSIAASMIMIRTIIAIPGLETYVSVIDACGDAVDAAVGCGCSTAKVVSVDD